MMFLAALAALAQPGAGADAWDAPPFRNQLDWFATFSVRRAFEDTTTEVTMVAFSNYDEVERGNYLFKRKVMSNDNDTTAYSYTSTSECPAALRPLRRLSRLRMPRPRIPSFAGEESVVVTDGAHYVLRVEATHADGQLGAYEIDSNVGTPLARWVDSMLAALRQCWSSAARL